jgi:hypothetical protein
VERERSGERTVGERELSGERDSIKIGLSDERQYGRSRSAPMLWQVGIAIPDHFPNPGIRDWR